MTKALIALVECFKQFSKNYEAQLKKIKLLKKLKTSKLNENFSHEIHKTQFIKISISINKIA